MGSRRQGRKLAMQALYQSEFHLSDLGEWIGKQNAEESASEWAKELLETVQINLADIDELIKTYSRGWEISRLNMVDKAILRLAFGELVYLKGTPKVVIDEAIEIAKSFSEDSAPKFINGILGQYVKDQCLPDSSKPAQS